MVKLLFAPLVALHGTVAMMAAALILLVAGCRGEPVGAKVSFVETRVDETQSPLPFVIAFKNAGDAAVDVSGVSIAAMEGVVLPNGEVAKGAVGSIAAADCQVEMREGHPVEAPARGNGVACGFVRWKRPDEAAPAVAVAAVRFLVTLDNGASIETPPRIFLLSSAPEALEKYIEELSLNRETAREALRRVESLQGERTAPVEQLIDRLRILSR